MTHQGNRWFIWIKKVDITAPASSVDGIFQVPPSGLKNFAILFYHAAKKNQKPDIIIGTL